MINNAIKYSYENSNIVLNGSIDSGLYKLEIQDFGLGMTDEQINSLFSISGKKSTPGTKNEKGSGLGLIITKELADNNHCRLEVSSELKSGTIFKLLIPLNTLTKN